MLTEQKSNLIAALLAIPATLLVTGLTYATMGFILQ